MSHYPILGFVKYNHKNVRSAERALNAVLTRLGRDVAVDRDNFGVRICDPLVDLAFHIPQFGVDTFENFDLLHTAPRKIEDLDGNRYQSLDSAPR